MLKNEQNKRLSIIIYLAYLAACNPVVSFDTEPLSYGQSVQAIESMNSPWLLYTWPGETLKIDSTHIYLSSGRPVCPGLASCKGLEFTAQVNSSSTVDLQIGDVSADASYFKVNYKKDGVWEPLCQSGKDEWVIPIPGSWNATATRQRSSSSFTFACPNSAAYKCKQVLGYNPYDRPDYYDTCIRVIRADYCGDGSSHTILGQPLALADAIGINSEDSSDPAWYPEAVWDIDGILCVDRRQPASRYEGFPHCAYERSAFGCYDIPFSSHALIKTRIHLDYPPSGCDYCTSHEKCCGDYCELKGVACLSAFP